MQFTFHPCLLTAPAPQAICLATWSHGHKATATTVTREEGPLYHCTVWATPAPWWPGRGPVTLTDGGGGKVSGGRFSPVRGRGQEGDRRETACPSSPQCTGLKCGGSVRRLRRQPGCLSNQLRLVAKLWPGQKYRSLCLSSSIPAPLPFPALLLPQDRTPRESICTAGVASGSCVRKPRSEDPTCNSLRCADLQLALPSWPSPLLLRELGPPHSRKDKDI